MMKKLTLSVVFLLISVISVAQKSFSVTIQFPKEVDTQHIRMGYDNGRERIAVPSQFVNNQMTVSGTYFSRYVTLSMLDEEKESFVDMHYFWVDGTNASITFTSKGSNENIFNQSSLKNAYRLDVVGKELQDFTRAELNAYKVFYRHYFSPTYEGEYTDSLARVFDTIYSSLRDKEIEFIKSRPTDYFAFDYFRRTLATDHTAHPDTLLSVFHLFSNEWKGSFEGNELELFLKGKALRKNAMAPIIEAADYYSKDKLSLQNKNYTLLVFWASWCKPCLAEIPQIKTLRSKFSEDDLTIIYVTLDEEVTLFEQAVKKWDLRWSHIFGNKPLIKTFGVLGIPQIFLVDKEGRIAYSREEEKDFSAQLPVLEKLLEDIID